MLSGLCSSNNPSGKNGVDPLAPYASEMQACGEAGNVLVFDSRLWHATAPNRSDRPRVGLAVRFAVRLRLAEVAGVTQRHRDLFEAES